MRQRWLAAVLMYCEPGVKRVAGHAFIEAVAPQSGRAAPRRSSRLLEMRRSVANKPGVPHKSFNSGLDNLLEVTSTSRNASTQH
jgi:hypothetical protein